MLKFLDVLHRFCPHNILLQILDDEEIAYKGLNWFKDGLESFRHADWNHEVDRFHLNNDGAQKALEQFAVSLF